ncbi:elongation factor G [Clostridium sp.]|uniref:elongation factor G n=1 Tax=Clostridium sp. TaxID=1506 RepID=UPI00260EDB68|nr:elongation factor G [Clostridium sp.]
MKEYKIENLRNVCIIGHSDSGKTALTEALLYYTNTTDRLGTCEDGNTTSDYDQEEKRRRISLSLSVVPFEWNGIKVNLLDTPGYFDFVGEQIEGIKAADSAIITVCGVTGIQVGTEKAWECCEKEKLPRAFFINKLDRENSNFDKILESIRNTFGNGAIPTQYPIGLEKNFNGIVNLITQEAFKYEFKSGNIMKIDIPDEIKDKVEEYRTYVMEAVAETHEELLDKYFSEGELTVEEIYRGLSIGFENGDIAPVMCGSSYSIVGMQSLLSSIKGYFPAPNFSEPRVARDKEGDEIAVKVDKDKPFSAFVFKTIADPFVGRLSMFKVQTGELTSDKIIINSKNDKVEKVGSLCFLRGKDQIQTKKIQAGDIGAITKLQYTITGDTLCENNFKVQYENFDFPEPVMTMAVLPKSKGDEEKISQGLSKLLDEDPTFKVLRDKENAETLISGIGETHIEVLASKLKSKFGVDLNLQDPKVPYRETIKGNSDVQGKHKKQSGGHGQYGDVKIKFEPRRDGEFDLDFVDKVVGGVVPRNYIPAVEKGLKDCLKKGVLAGYPVIGIKATLHDGSYHPVDSSEMAFKVAASIAYKKGMESAKPVILEPIMRADIFIPDEYMGDVIGDINKKRGRVVGMEPYGKNQRVIAEVPLSEMFKYATDLRSITQARGSFSMVFEKYEEVPSTETAKIIEAAKKLK